MLKMHEGLQVQKIPTAAVLQTVAIQGSGLEVAALAGDKAEGSKAPSGLSARK